MAPTPADWKRRQHRLNLFTSRYVGGVGPIREDGAPGPSTSRRIREAKWWLGWNDHSDAWSDNLAAALRDPRNRAYSRGGAVARGTERRAAHKARVARGARQTGVSVYDGVNVAAWMVPYLDWARQRGYRGRRWTGNVRSGYRDPAYSESLCYAMCGRPSCPGKCAGRSSNHSGKRKPAGALDVTDYVTFGQLMAHCPLSPRLRNDLGPDDPVHFSVSGH